MPLYILPLCVDEFQKFNCLMFEENAHTQAAWESLLSTPPTPTPGAVLQSLLSSDCGHLSRDRAPTPRKHPFTILQL